MLRPYLVRRYLGFCWPCGVILVGTALYVHLMVYMGLSLFIIRRALCVSGCMRTYAYNLTQPRLGGGGGGGGGGQFLQT